MAGSLSIDNKEDVTVPDQQTSTGYVYDSIAVYQVCVYGEITPDWSDRLEGMTITASHGPGKTCVTRLEGRLHGQPALFGVLRTLYDQRLTLVSVTRLDT